MVSFSRSLKLTDIKPVSSCNFPFHVYSSWLPFSFKAMNLSLPLIWTPYKMKLQVKVSNWTIPAVVFPFPRKTGPSDANSAFVTVVIHKCNRKLLSQTILCNAMGHLLPPSNMVKLPSQELPCSVFSDTAALKKKKLSIITVV